MPPGHGGLQPLSMATDGATSAVVHDPFPEGRKLPRPGDDSPTTRYSPIGTEDEGESKTDGAGIDGKGMDSKTMDGTDGHAQVSSEAATSASVSEPMGEMVHI